MNKTLVIFLAAFAIGAAATLGFRVARHRPYAPPAADQPAPAAPAAATSQAPVNTICAICGMDVDPDIATAQYQGKTIGFGCAACPPKFAANPDTYGPFALQNKEAE